MKIYIFTKNKSFILILFVLLLASSCMTEQERMLKKYNKIIKNNNFQNKLEDYIFKGEYYGIYLRDFRAKKPPAIWKVAMLEGSKYRLSIYEYCGANSYYIPEESSQCFDIFIINKDLNFMLKNDDKTGCVNFTVPKDTIYNVLILDKEVSSNKSCRCPVGFLEFLSK